jgi:ribosome biogenesis GTPase
MTLDLASLGWDADFAAAYVRHDVRGQRPVRVTQVDQGVATALGASGSCRASLGGAQLLRAARDPLAMPAVGDWAVVRTWPDRRVTMEAILPRRTQLIDADGPGRAAAANLDVAAVVEPLDGSPDRGRIERLLSLAWDSGARPILLLTKCDLAPDPDAIAASLAASVPALEVIPISARTGVNLDRLYPYIGPGQTLGLLGSPGAGKTTLVNALSRASVLALHQIRRPGIFRVLIPLPHGGHVVDTSPLGVYASLV